MYRSPLSCTSISHCCYRPVFTYRPTTPTYLTRELDARIQTLNSTLVPNCARDGATLGGIDQHPAPSGDHCHPHHPVRLGAEKKMPMVVTTKATEKIQKKRRSITMAANFQSPITSLAWLSSLILRVMKRNSFRMASSSLRTLCNPPSSNLVHRMYMSFTFTGMELSTSRMFDSRLRDGGLRDSRSRIVAFFSRNSRERS